MTTNLKCDERWRLTIPHRVACRRDLLGVFALSAVGGIAKIPSLFPVAFLVKSRAWLEYARQRIARHGREKKAYTASGTCLITLDLCGSQYRMGMSVMLLVNTHLSASTGPGRRNVS